MVGELSQNLPSDTSVSSNEDEAENEDENALHKKQDPCALLKSERQHVAGEEKSEAAKTFANTAHDDTKFILRESISNASDDALNKNRYLSLADPSVLDSEKVLEILIGIQGGTLPMAPVSPPWWNWTIFKQSMILFSAGQRNESGIAGK